MMGLLTTLSLVGSLVLWAGYQAFYVPTNYTDPIPDQTSLDDPFSDQNIPRKAFGRARFHAQIGSSILPQVNSISKTGISYLGSQRESETTSDLFTSSTQRSDTGQGFYGLLPFGELLTAKDIETKGYFDEGKGKTLKEYEGQSKIITQTGEVMNPDRTPSYAIPITISVVTHSVGLSEKVISEINGITNRTTAQTSGDDDIHNTTELEQLITTEDSHTLLTDVNVSDHNTIDKQGLENLSRLAIDLPVRNDSLHMAKMVNQSVSSLNILYTLVTFVKNLESQERGNFSKVFDDLLYSNVSKTNIHKGTDKLTIEDIAKSLLNSTDETESNGTGGFSETPDRHNQLGITPAERIASEDAKVLSKEYMDHFGWQGYLLIFFIIVIVLLLITTLILFASSYFTWRNRRKQTKKTKASNSHKEA